MEIHEIRYFLAVAEHKNVTRAAQNCGVSLPAITRAIPAKAPARLSSETAMRLSCPNTFGLLMEPSRQDRCHQKCRANPRHSRWPAQPVEELADERSAG